MINILPPSDFALTLKQYDPDLFLNWDPVCERWSVWHKDPYDGSVNHVLNVINDDGSYRQLDGRVFQILDRNRYFASRPEELIKIVCDDPFEKQVIQEEKSKKDLEAFSKDPFLKKRWNGFIEKTLGISWDKWSPENKPSDNDVKEILSETIQPNA